MRRAMIAAPLALLWLCGCVTFERASYRIAYDREKKLGTVEARYENLQSDEEKPEAQRRDFQELLESVRGDAYLVEQMREGRYVKSRRLEVRGRELVASESSLVGELAAAGLEEDSTGTIWWTDRDFEVTRTDGHRNAARDSVWWAPGSTRFELEMSNRKFEPRSNFAKWYKAAR